jgi:hypothetical protein
MLHFFAVVPSHEISLTLIALRAHHLFVYQIGSSIPHWRLLKEQVRDDGITSVQSITTPNPSIKINNNNAFLIFQGSAPDGDEDAIAGMILGVKVRRNYVPEPYFVRYTMTSSQKVYEFYLFFLVNVFRQLSTTVHDRRGMMRYASGPMRLRLHLWRTKPMRPFRIHVLWSWDHVGVRELEWLARYASTFNGNNTLHVTNMLWY